jgi:hypothetical protein
MTASILPFEASSHRQLFVAVEEALLGAQEAAIIFEPSADVANILALWSSGEREAALRLADKNRINSTPTGEQAP